MSHTLSERPTAVTLPRKVFIMSKRYPEKTLTSSVWDVNTIEQIKSWFLDVSRPGWGILRASSAFISRQAVQRVSGRSGFGRRIEFLTSARAATTHEWSI